jgi:hypothetical protein
MSAMEPRAEGEYDFPYEFSLDAIPSRKHKSLLESYKMNLERGSDAVCDMIIGDVERFIELGARQRAADLLLVLRLFVSGLPKGDAPD